MYLDDCRLLSKTGITENKIINSMKDDYILFANDNHKYTDGATDQYILAKKFN